MHKNYIITRASFPNGYASTNRIKCYAKALGRGGANCEVIIYQRNNIKGNDEASGIFEGIFFRYISRKSIRSTNKYKARLFDLYDRIRLCLFLLFNIKKGDTVYGYELIPFHFFLILITHIKRARFYAELCEYPYISELSKKTKWHKIIGTWYIFHCQLSMYDGIIAISDTLVELARKYANPNCRIIKIPILVDMNRIHHNRMANPEDDKYIFHSGTLTEQKDGILGMIEAYGMAISQLNIPLKFYCTGEKETSPQVKEIDTLIQKYNLQNSLIFTGFLSESILAEKMGNASMVIINKYPTRQNKYCFSTKLGEYMAWGLPVIITQVGEAMNWLHNGKDAIIVKPYEKQELASAIIRLINDDELRKRITGNAITTCQTSFAYENHSDILKDFFNPS